MHYQQVNRPVLIPSLWAMSDDQEKPVHLSELVIDVGLFRWYYLNNLIIMIIQNKLEF